MTINYKVFAAGDTLSANDVLTYLENQAVIKVDTASELPTLASTYPNVKVAYAADTDKVYVNDDGTYVALVTADGTVTLSNLTLTGNLTVQGTTTTIDSTTVAIKDKFVFEGATPDAFETELVVAEPTADRTVTIPDATTTLVGRDTTDTLTNKTINLSSNTLSGTLAQLNTAVSDADVVSLAGAETLTNKTINLASNTVSTTLAQLNTAITDADVATLAGSETLTNKTISGASNTLTNIGNASLTNSSITINGTPVSLGGTASVSSYSLPSQTGNSGKFLTTNGTDDSWGTVDLTTKTDKATLTTTGDIYYASSANTPARLGIGSTNQVLTVSGGIPSWATPAGGSSSFQGCSLYGTDPGNFELSAGENRLITWNQELFDVGGYHSTSSNTDRITIPSGKAGYYLINAAMTFDDDNAVATCGIRVYLNNTLIATRLFLRSDNGGRTSADVQVTRNLAVSDYLQVYAYTETAQGAYHYSPDARFEVIFVGNA
jgi:hypothetical protein